LKMKTSTQRNSQGGQCKNGNKNSDIKSQKEKIKYCSIQANSHVSHQKTGRVFLSGYW